MKFVKHLSILENKGFRCDGFVLTEPENTYSEFFVKPSFFVFVGCGYGLFERSCCALKKILFLILLIFNETKLEIK